MGNKIIYDDETGEILGKLNDGDKIVRKSQIDYLKNKNDYKQEYIKNDNKNCKAWGYNKFMVLNMEEFQLINKELTPHEKIFIFSIQANINYKHSCVMKNQKTPANLKDIMEITALKKTNFYATLNSLTKKDMIFRGRNSKQELVFINPWIIMRGDRINRVLKVMFENYYIRSLGKQWKDLNDIDISGMAIDFNKITHKGALENEQ